jgi:magnesium transporter
VFSVMFLPPTLVAGIYGMNFEHMPELKWMHGYPFAIVVMLVAALGPLMWFRRRGWL